MPTVATVANKCHFVAIYSYHHNLVCIATKYFVAIDPNSCSGWKMCIPKDRGGMCFQNLHTFNTAMLAKQCWRFMEEPDSLCARVIRAKYYPDGNFLKARLKGESYFMW
jgi:hypothetical protein